MLVHIHIPKNGGTTFSDILYRHFGSSYVDLYNQERPGHFYSNTELVELLNTHKKAEAIASHSLRYPLPELPGVKYNYLTFIRHPVDRCLSMYFYEKEHRKAEYWAHLPFEEYIEVRGEFNGQTHHIHQSGDPVLAQEVLNQYTLVGIIENYDASLSLLSYKVGLPLSSMMYDPLNVSKSFTAKEHLSERLYQQVVRLNEKDIELYNFATHWLDTEIRNCHNFFSFSSTFNILQQQHFLIVQQKKNLQDLTEKNKELSRIIENVQNSRSWRLTAPLRKMGISWRKIKGRILNKKSMSYTRPNPEN